MGSIRDQIVEGVQIAGLLDTFNHPKFTLDDIVNNARVVDSNLPEKYQWGIYLRVYKLDGKTELYIGKSRDMVKRWRSASHHTDPNTRHGKILLNPNTKATWYTLCILTYRPKGAVVAICEQVFTCLLESYRSDIHHPSGYVNALLVNFVADAKFIVDAAQAAQAKSGWPGALWSRHHDFGASDAHNVQTPLSEATNDSALLIRTDAYHEHEGEIVHIVNYRRASPKTAHYYDGNKAKKIA
jgi:hypothetical protein